MVRVKKCAAALVLVLAWGLPTMGVLAREPAQREVTLSASAHQSVVQDWLRMRLSARAEGADASAVQAQIKASISHALEQVQSLASGQALRVRTDGFSMQPRYKNSRADGWVGQAWLVIEGRDFGLVGQASARLSDLMVEQVGLSVSPELTRTTREQVRLEAIAAFRAQALAVAQAFGFVGYELVDINVGGDTGSDRPPVFMGRAMAMASDAAPVPVSASVESIGVQVSGRIRLQ